MGEATNDWRRTVDVSGDDESGIFDCRGAADCRREVNISGDTGMGIIGFEEAGSSIEVGFVGDGGSVEDALKKLTANAGFSRIISRNRRSSLCLSGRPGRRSNTSLVLINERNNVCAQGKACNLL